MMANKFYLKINYTCFYILILFTGYRLRLLVAAPEVRTCGGTEIGAMVVVVVVVVAVVAVDVVVVEEDGTSELR
jgi:hypothetical protein